MANKLKFAGQAGVTAVAVITDRTNDKVWNGEELVTYVDADFETYHVSLTELGHGNYSASVPSALPAGRYHVAFYDDDSDEVVFQYLFKWDGTDLVEDLDTGTVTLTDICNMALSHLGIGKTIDDVTTSDAAEADAFNLFWGTTRDEILKIFPWPFAMINTDLTLVEENPTVEWAFSYRYPSNSLELKRIYSGTRNDTIDSRIPYRITRDDGGLLVYTDMEDAIMEYIFRETDPDRYTPDFVTAISFLMAFKMAPRLTKGDPYKLGNRAFEAFKIWIEMAKVTSANEEVLEKTPDSEFERARV